MRHRHGRAGIGSDVALGLPMLTFLVLPMVALAVHAPGAVIAAVRSQEAHEAIIVSLRSSLACVFVTVLGGTPLAILLGRGRFIGKGIAGAIVEAPLVLPPAAAGIGLLLALGRNGVIPTQLPFSFGAVVIAQTFVAAPLYVLALSEALGALDPQWSDAAATDGASYAQTLRLIRIPLVRSACVTGIVVCWARALGEFGATILFAGNLAGKTQTMPLAIYLGLESNLDQAIGLSVLLLFASFAVLVTVKGFGSRP